MMYAWTFTLRARFASSLILRRLERFGSPLRSLRKSCFSFCAARSCIETDSVHKSIKLSGTHLFSRSGAPFPAWKRI